MNYADSDELTETSGTYMQCFHKNGYYFSVKCKIFGIEINRKKMFWCDDCKNAIEAKSIKK